MNTSTPRINSKAWRNAILAAIYSGKTEFKTHPEQKYNPHPHTLAYSSDTLKKAHQFLLTLNLPKTTI